MRLFTFDTAAFRINDEWSLNFDTVLGQIHLDCLCNQKSLRNIVPQENVMLNSETTLTSWLIQECCIELLLINFKPILPLGMHVEQCLAAIWRIKSFKEGVAFDFKCWLDSSLQPSPESGERLLSQLFEDQFNKLSLGTEDEEGLIARATNADWMPLRFRELLRTDNVNYTTKGLEVNLPECMRDEYVQIKFIIACASKANDELSTWYAVDQPLIQIFPSCL